MIASLFIYLNIIIFRLQFLKKKVFSVPQTKETNPINRRRHTKKCLSTVSCLFIGIAATAVLSLLMLINQKTGIIYMYLNFLVIRSICS